jgi:CheY-like chemotaxis protein
VSRVSQGKIELRKERIQAADVIRSALESSQPLIEAAGHSLSIDLPPEPIWLDGDMTRLAQVVGNLLNNAAKYTPAGGRIGLSLHAQGHEAVIAVSDNGLGIPAAMQTKIFQLFTQVDDHAFHAQGGLGIGLALVKQLVDMHGGSITVESAGTGSGSTFTIRTPLAAADALPQADDQSAEPVTARSLNILIVDDIVEVAQTVGWMLEEMGHDYRLIHDGREALAAARDYNPDVILLDIGLPVMDGYEVCRAFRQDPRFTHTVIVAQTGWGQTRDKVEAAAAGFDHHLVKPVTYDALEQLLSSLPIRTAA